MNLQQLYYFHTMYEELNYTHASKKLMITQSSLSHSIANLEEEFGVCFFVKKDRGIVPTVFADQFNRHAVNILRELDAIQMELSTSINPQGPIRLGISCTMSQHYIPDLLEKFGQNENNRNVQFQLQELTALYVNNALKEGTIDLGFSAKIEDPELSYHQISADEMELVVPEDSPLARESFVSYRELENECLVLYPYTCGTRYYLDELFKTHGIVPKKIIEATTERLILGQVAAGRGVAIIPKMGDFDRTGTVSVPLENGKLLRPMYMVWLKNRRFESGVRRFRRFVMDQVNEVDFMT